MPGFNRLLPLAGLWRWRGMSYETPMRDRPTARVVLLDAEDRILLVRGKLPGSEAWFWFTPGGGMEPGETILQGAARELLEETGITPHALGPVVWTRSGAGRLFSGETVMFREHFVIARTTVTSLTRDGWEPHEHILMDEMRWFSQEELAAAAEPLSPLDLPGLLARILAGEVPAEPLQLPSWDTD